jgi:hypothetical protein
VNATRRGSKSNTLVNGFCVIQKENVFARMSKSANYSWEVTSRHGRGHYMVNPSGPLHAPVILFGSAFPRQRSKSPGEQRFAAIVSDSDYLLQPEPLVLTEGSNTPVIER